MKSQLSPRKTRMQIINTRLEEILRDIQVQQELLVEMKKEAIAIAKKERERAKLLSPRKPAKKSRRESTRKPKHTVISDPFVTTLSGTATQ